MEKIEIDTYFGDRPTHIEIAASQGVGNVYHVAIDKYYNSQIILRSVKTDLFPDELL